LHFFLDNVQRKDLPCWVLEFIQPFSEEECVHVREIRKFFWPFYPEVLVLRKDVLELKVEG
jgi:hypothetical protein